MKKIFVFLSTFCILGNYGLYASSPAASNEIQIVQVGNLSDKVGCINFIKHYDDSLFVGTDKGLYAYDLKRGGEWKTYENLKDNVYGFVKYKNQIMVTTHSLEPYKYSLLYSDNYGDTYTEIILIANTWYELYSLAQNPYHPQTIYIGTGSLTGEEDWPPSYSMSISDDFGKTWRSETVGLLGSYGMAFSQNNDGVSLAYGLKAMFDCICPFVCTTNDDYQTVNYMDFDITNEDRYVRTPYDMTYSPANKNIILFASESGIGRSDDEGKTWQYVTEEMSFEDILFDNDNSSLVYSLHNTESGIILYYSKDDGCNWEILGSISGINSYFVRMLMIGNNIFLCDTKNNIYYIDKSSISSGILLQEKENISKINEFDLSGRRLNSEPQHGVYIKDGKKVVK